MTSPYQYQPLQSSRHIRLIHIQSSNDPDDAIHFSFCTSTLDSPIDYQTLSYTWGRTFTDGSHLTHPTFCEGRALMVTSNLHDFLVELREEMKDDRPECGLPIWIDALCINQSDADERGQQVALMSRIYIKSRRLIIWLGHLRSGDASNLASFEMYPDGQTSFKEHRRLSEQMKEVFGHPWFYRRWIIQEVVHTREDDRVFWIGEVELPCRALMRSIFLLMYKDAPGPLGNFTEFHHDEVAEKLCLLHAMWRCKDAECSDPRDRMHSLLSISNDAEDFEIDYTNDTEFVYRNMAEVIVRSGRPGQFVMLHACATAFQNNYTLPIMPSWVPDWQGPVVHRTPDDQYCVENCLSPTPIIDLH